MTTIAPVFIRAAILEQAARTSKSSKAQIKQLLEESESRITSLELRVAALVEELARERAAAIVLRHLIAPIRTLPTELLAEIFVLTIRRPTELRNSRRSHFKDAFRVSHVCSEWREVAMGTPRLWTGPIELTDLPAESQDDIDGLKAWLAHSAPLAIPISLRRCTSNHRTFDEVLKIAPRWRSLRLSGMPLPVFCRFVEGPFDSLKEMDLSGVGGMKASHFGSAPSFPRLQKLSINADPSFPMPWSQLTDLSLTVTKFGVVSQEFVFDILTQCLDLVNASITIAGWRAPSPAGNIITLVRLRSLRVNMGFFIDGIHFMPFLDRLSAPALEELRLFLHSHSVWMAPQFTAFQLRSPNLRRLEINNSPSYSDLQMTWDDLRTALVHSPSLIHLSLSNCAGCIEDTFFRALSYTAGVETLAPRLHSLILAGLSGNQLTESGDILAGMIASRWWTDEELASYAAPPSVARWTQVALRFRQGKLGDYFMDFTKGFQDMGILKLVF